MNIEQFLEGSIGEWISIRQYIYASGKRQIIETEFSIEEGNNSNEVVLQWSSKGDASSQGEMVIEFLPDGTIKRNRGYFTEQETVGTWSIFHNCVLMKNSYNGMEYVESIALVDRNTRVRNTYAKKLSNGEFHLVGNYIEKRKGFEGDLKDIYKAKDQPPMGKMPPAPIVSLTLEQEFDLRSLLSKAKTLLDNPNNKSKDVILSLLATLYKQRSLNMANVKQLLKGY